MSDRFSDSPVQHPIELVSRFVTQHDWYLRQSARNAILADVPGEWSHYQLSVTWQAEAEALVVICHLDLPYVEAHQDAVIQVSAMLNQELWLGHFVYDQMSDRLSLRHTLPLRGAGGATAEQIEDLVDIILGESELAYPVLYQVAVGELAAADAVGLTLVAHQGEA